VGARFGAGEMDFKEVGGGRSNLKKGKENVYAGRWQVAQFGQHEMFTGMSFGNVKRSVPKKTNMGEERNWMLKSVRKAVFHVPGVVSLKTRL